MNRSRTSIPFDVEEFRQALQIWYGKARRDLPWRRTTDPYRIWLSEVMLQQTQVATVIPFYERFVRRFPTMNALARAEQQEVLKSWEGLGYYARARNFHRACQLISDRPSQEIPSDPAEFRKLPGVGTYIAAAVLSIAFNRPFAVVDGNVKRVLSRLFEMEEAANDPSSLPAFSERAGELLDKKDPGTFNQAFMELGAIVCRASSPDCEHCAVSAHCAAQRSGTQDRFPRRKPRRRQPTRRMASLILRADDAFLLVQRAEDGLLGGLWEFPSVELQTGDEAMQTSRAWLAERLGENRGELRDLCTVRHAYTHFKVEVTALFLELNDRRELYSNEIPHEWLTLEEVIDYPLPRVVHKILPHLLKAAGPDGPTQDKRS